MLFELSIVQTAQIILPTLVLRQDYKEILGICKGLLKLDVKKQGNYEIKVDSSTSKVRPFVTGIIARNGSLDDESIKQLINMQEDLHLD